MPLAPGPFSAPSGDGQEILFATPAAVIDYDDEAADLDVDLRTATGEIRLTQYYTASGGVGAKGYVKARKIQQGTSGTPITLQTLEYTSRTAAGTTVFPLSKSTAYPNQDGTGAIDTTYAYQWYAGTVQQKQRTVTLPAVSTSHNGSGVAAIRKDYFDQHGYVTWRMDERGYIARHIYL